VIKSSQKSRLAIGSQLKSCPSVITLGVCANLDDYPDWKLELIHRSSKIYFPTSLFAEMFVAMGKEIFPGIQTYRFVGDKIKQTILFKLYGLFVPKTRFYYGPLQKKNITREFTYPFVAKVPRFSSRGFGVKLIENNEQLEEYLQGRHPAYIQEFLPGCRDYRVVIAGERIIHCYQRVARDNEFRANVSLGAELSFQDIPDEALDLALKAARLCGFNYTGIDICESGGKYYLIEANMKFGTQGFREAGLDFKTILCKMAENGEV
jgi:ribosomal protein S6--L-glutamate ligase